MKDGIDLSVGKEQLWEALKTHCDTTRQQPKDLNAAIDESSRRVSSMSRWERKRLRWRGLAMIYGIKLPEGVNIKRLKKFRKLTARRDTQMEKRVRDARRFVQASKHWTDDLSAGLTMAS